MIHGGFDVVWIKNGRGEHILEQLTGLGGVEHVAGLVDAELVEDYRELLLQHFADAELYRVLKHEVDCPYRLGLADTVHTADPLFQPHRVPGDVVIDNDMGELQVQALTTRVGGNQHSVRFAEGVLGLLAFLHVHGAVQGDDRDPPGLQKLFQHLLGGYEFGEDQRLQVRLVFLGLQFVDPLDQRLGLGVRSSLFAANRRIEQGLHMTAFTLQSRHMGFQQFIEQLLAVHVVELGHFIIGSFRSLRAVFQLRQAQAGLLFAFLECGKSPFQRSADRPGAGDHQTLHQDHQKADVELFLPQGLVVALAHIVGHCLVEELL